MLSQADGMGPQVGGEQHLGAGEAEAWGRTMYLQQAMVPWVGMCREWITALLQPHPCTVMA